MKSIIAIFFSLFPLLSWADLPRLFPAWQSEAVLQQPESIVYDAKRKQLYVSNVNGNPSEADGNGYISTLDIDGNIINQHWLKDLNAPKGMTISQDKLYVADINELVVIDLAKQAIIKRYQAPAAKFLNDVTADNNGVIYVSGFLTDSIYRLKDNKFEQWLVDTQLASPNGLLVENDKLIVASWGRMTDGFATEVLGHLNVINIKDKSISSLGDATPAGNLDGIEADGEGNYFVTDWMAGKLLQITPHGINHTLLWIDPGSADHTVIADKKMILIPMMQSGFINAFTFE